VTIQKPSIFLCLSKLAVKIKIENICFNYVGSTDCSVVSRFLSGKKDKEKTPASLSQSSSGAKINYLLSIKSYDFVK
jgi:hypothetical protein